MDNRQAISTNNTRIRTSKEKLANLPVYENITPETERYTELLEMAITNLQNKCFVPPVKEGQHVWKKYEYYGITATELSYSPVTLQLSAKLGGLSLVDETFFDGWTLVRGNGARFILNGDGTGTAISASGSTESLAWSYNPSSQTITTNKTYTTPYKWYVEPILDFTYIVDNSDDTYPTDGELDNFWYELLFENAFLEQFGITKFEEFEVTQAARTACSNTNISHSLGVIPKLVMIMVKSEPGTKAVNDVFGISSMRFQDVEDATTVTYNAVVEYYSNTAGSKTRQSTSVVVTDSTLKCSQTTCYFTAGLTYKVLIGG